MTTPPTGWWQPGTTYSDALRSMSDDVLIEEAFATHNHLLAAGLEADADLFAEVCARLWGGPRKGTPDA